MRILLVEDESSIFKPLTAILQSKGMAVDLATDGQEGLQMCQVNTYDCILLDINLPKISGDQLLAKVRSEQDNLNKTTPILMLTAANAQSTKYLTFANGADDYLTKPFDTQELFLRINALVKRNSSNKSVIISYKNLVVNPITKTTTLNGKSINLTNKEFRILEYLLRNQGRVVSSEELLEHVWDNTVDLFSDTVRTHIKTLRKQIDPNKNIITTVNSVGYTIKQE